ncbi:hypothetical protein BMF77_03800 [Dolichospermum sp. UHCC 0315A]|uniref:restriction endonuclease subunit S n=1 Tax=Dolichospermum sp. UHCC 0315A TaxID=1914871 RepID=UPI0011E6B263|nr:restriction endonuclease subunit S [Dolichospermum sp. UHCC 0315A]QEI43184.1 hypothetical protein BMF77_03800 [Dolichospermum sp. UHCC 0315A]
MCFGVEQGKAKKRFSVEFYQPIYQIFDIRLENSKFTCRSLSEICSLISDGTHHTPRYISDDKHGIHFISVKDVREWEISFEKTKFISEEEHHKLAKRCSPKTNDILLTKIGTIGKAALVPSNPPIFDIFVSVALLRLNENSISPPFVTYFLNSQVAKIQFSRVVKGIGVPDLHLEDIAAIKIPIPPLNKQIELVAAMDEARSQRNQKLAEADALLSSLDDYLLKTLGLESPVKDERKVFAIQTSIISGRFDPHFHAPNFKKIYRLLSKTTTKKLGEIVQFSKDSWNPKDEEKLTFRYIEISNVKPQTGEAIWTETLTKEAPSRARMLVHGDDIIVSLTRPHHGSIAHLSEEFDGCIASTGFAIIRSVSKLVNREYLWCILRSQLSLQQMLQRSSGGNYPAITKTELENIIIPIPEISIQEQIVAEIQRRRSESQRLRSEAESGWQAAKQWFEEQLLGGS